MSSVIVKKDHVISSGVEKKFEDYYPTPECIQCGNGKSGFDISCTCSCNVYREWEVIREDNEKSGLFGR